MDHRADRRQSGGKDIAYTVSEDAVEGYTTEITGSIADGYTITNRRGSPQGPQDSPASGTDPNPPDAPDKSSAAPNSSGSPLPLTSDALLGAMILLALAIAGLLAASAHARSRSRRQK